MCFAVRIVVVAPTRQRRLSLRRAAVSAEWEVVGDAESPADGVAKVTALRARFMVLDETAAGSDAAGVAATLAALQPRVFLVGVGEVAGADARIAAGDLPRLRTVLAGLLHDSGDHAH